MDRTSCYPTIKPSARWATPLKTWRQGYVKSPAYNSLQHHSALSYTTQTNTQLPTMPMSSTPQPLPTMPMSSIRQPLTEPAHSVSLATRYAEFLNHLSSKKLHTYVLHWLNHLTHQPPEHTQLFFDYLSQPSHRWTCTLPRAKTPTLVKVVAVQHAPTETNSRTSTSRRAAPSPKLTWTVETKEGAIHRIHTATSTTDGPFLSNPSVLNIPQFLIRTISAHPSSTTPALVLAPVYFGASVDFPALNVNDWQARISLQPTYQKSTTTNLSALAHISYYHPEHGHLPRYSHPVFTPYYNLTNDETFSLFQALQRSVASLFLHGFTVFEQLKTTFGSLAASPTLRLPLNSVPLIEIVLQSPHNPDLQLCLSIALADLTSNPIENNTPHLRFSFHLRQQTQQRFPQQGTLLLTHLSCPTSDDISLETHGYIAANVQNALTLFQEAYQQSLSC